MSSKEIAIKKLQNYDLEDFLSVLQLFESVFEMKDLEIPTTKHLNKILNSEELYVFTASIQQKIIGAICAYKLEQYYSKKPLAYIFDLAVVMEFRRKGVGSILIESVRQYFKENGFEEIFVQADQSEHYALDFYRSTRPIAEEKVIHFYYVL